MTPRRGSVSWLSATNGPRRCAAEMAAGGQRATLFLFSPTARFHRMCSTPGGW